MECRGQDDEVSACSTVEALTVQNVKLTRCVGPAIRIDEGIALVFLPRVLQFRGIAKVSVPGSRKRTRSCTAVRYSRAV